MTLYNKEDDAELSQLPPSSEFIKTAAGSTEMSPQNYQTTQFHTPQPGLFKLNFPSCVASSINP